MHLQQMAQVSLRALSSQTNGTLHQDEKDGVLPSPNYNSQVEMVLAINEKDKKVKHEL